MLGNSFFHILWTSRASFSPCPYGIVVVVFHFDSGGLAPFYAWVSDQDCFTGQSPGCRGSLGAGWKAAGSGGVEGCFGEHLAEGGLVSLHVGAF